MPDYKYYRIGDFAKKLGVTPDLLKYCEKKGLITSIQQPNGYRYFDFSQSAAVLEYLKLKNQGFSAEESYAILHAESFRDFVAHQRGRERALQEQLRYTQALLRYIQHMDDIQEFFTDPPGWNLTKQEGFYFLPHSTDDTLHDNLQTAGWSAWLPVVTSAGRLGRLEENEPSVQWGLSAEERFALEQNLDVTPPVCYYPPCLCLQVYLTMDLGRRNSGVLRETVPEMLEHLGLEQCGESFLFMFTRMWCGESRKGYSMLSIPVRRKRTGLSPE